MTPFSFCSPKLLRLFSCNSARTCPSQPNNGGCGCYSRLPPSTLCLATTGQNSQAASGEPPSWNTCGPREIGKKTDHHCHHRQFRLAPAAGGGPGFLRPTGSEVKAQR